MGRLGRLEWPPVIWHFYSPVQVALANVAITAIVWLIATCVVGLYLRYRARMKP